MFHPMHHEQATRIDRALHMGLLHGRLYGDAMMSPACTMKRPRNPFWCPIRYLCWSIGFSLGVHDAVN
jgi:hypothetical protein